MSDSIGEGEKKQKNPPSKNKQKKLLILKHSNVYLMLVGVPNVCTRSWGEF